MITLVLVLSIFVVSYFGYWSARGMGNYYTETPMMISHRGVTKAFPENTIDAYKSSISAGYKGIELDVLSSLDILCSNSLIITQAFLHPLVALALSKRNIVAISLAVLG